MLEKYNQKIVCLDQGKIIRVMAFRELSDILNLGVTKILSEYRNQKLFYKMLGLLIDKNYNKVKAKT